MSHCSSDVERKKEGGVGCTALYQTIHSRIREVYNKPAVEKKKRRGRFKPLETEVFKGDGKKGDAGEPENSWSLNGEKERKGNRKGRAPIRDGNLGNSNVMRREEIYLSE